MCGLLPQLVGLRERQKESGKVRESVMQTEGVLGFGSAANSGDINMNSSCFNTIIALVLIIAIAGMDVPKPGEN